MVQHGERRIQPQSAVCVGAVGRSHAVSVVVYDRRHVLQAVPTLRLCDIQATEAFLLSCTGTLASATACPCCIEGRFDLKEGLANILPILQ